MKYRILYRNERYDPQSRRWWSPIWTNEYPCRFGAFEQAHEFIGELKARRKRRPSTVVWTE